MTDEQIIGGNLDDRLGTNLRHKQELSPDKVAAIRKAAELGIILQTNFPQIGADYGGRFLHQIAEDYNISSFYGVSRAVSRAAVRYAIAGYKGGFGVGSYAGLIKDKEEFRRIGKENNIRNGEISGERVAREGLGFNGLPKEVHRINSAKGGNSAYEHGKGYHSLSREEKRRFGLLGAISNGYVPYKDAEIEEAYELSQNQQYHHAKGPQKGKPMWQKIAAHINEKYYDGKPTRSVDTVKLYVRECRNAHKN